MVVLHVIYVRASNFVAADAAQYASFGNSDIAELVTPDFKTDKSILTFQSGLRDMLWIGRVLTLLLVPLTPDTWSAHGFLP